VLANLQRLKDRLARWETEEDLEDIVAEYTAPTHEECEAVARKYGPPTAWFEQGKDERR
jgi:hypothetical protein